MKRLRQRIARFVRRLLLLDDEFLCDRCKNDYGDACLAPERPNALECDRYERL